ncbi:MAG: trypsin-like peptidase domain-containing protein [Candidatus Brocadiae bacterium]|nr:trypsin-like peptidase domain-containing protein [Candidatus Brocadiia bacterium]
MVFLFHANPTVTQEKKYDNVVKITCQLKYQYKEFGWIWNSEKTISTIIYGTGFVLDGKIVTSKHVVCGLALEDYQAIQGEDGNIVQFNKNVILEKLIESKVRIGGLGIEPERIYISLKYDLAFLKISSEALETLRLQKLNVSHEEMYVGKKVEAWGFPSTSNPQVNIDLKITSIKDDWFVLNQSLEPGFSGGPIIDQNNHVLGIISRSEAKQSRIIAVNIMQVESNIFANEYGQGIMTCPNGEKYVGEFKNGKMNGQGTYTWPDGEKYVGEYKDGKMNGQGTYTWPDGEKYLGEYKDGKRNGQGTLTYPDGTKKVGRWKNGKYIGK